MKKSANRVLETYLKEVDIIQEICDKVYAVERAIGFKLGKLVESDREKGRKVKERRKVQLQKT